jgi:hypothetical protein
VPALIALAPARVWAYTATFRRGEMNIGEPKRTWTVEPIVEPVPHKLPAPEPTPARRPAPAREPVRVGT